MYRLAVEQTVPGVTVYHAVQEEGVALRRIAETLGRGLKVPVVSFSPEKAGEHFGWFAHFAGLDMPASSERSTPRGLTQMPAGIPPWRGVVNKTLSVLAALALISGVPKVWAATWPVEQRFRELYQELIETNTKQSAGSCTLAAERLAARLNAAGIPDSDLHRYVVAE